MPVSALNATLLNVILGAVLSILIGCDTVVATFPAASVAAVVLTVSASPLNSPALTGVYVFTRPVSDTVNWLVTF